MTDAGQETLELIDETGDYEGLSALEANMLELIAELGLADRQVTVVLMDDEAIRERNAADRDEDSPTDVLSYPTSEPDDVGFPQVPHLGDILISTETAARQASARGLSLAEELLVLTAHGLTHLSGHDHQDASAWRPFRQAERLALRLARRGHAPDGVPLDLWLAASEAFDNAYAPYSGYRVGAALRAEDGDVYAGANVENSSFGLTRCAEQSAVQALATAGGRAFTELVVVAGDEEPGSPCGSCRQVLFEFAPHATVWMVSRSGAVLSSTVAGLLPLGFRLPQAAEP